MQVMEPRHRSKCSAAGRTACLVLQDLGDEVDARRGESISSPHSW